MSSVTRMAACVAALGLMFPPLPADAGCHVRRQLAVVHHAKAAVVHHSGYAFNHHQPVQNFFYGVGQGIQLEAAVQKALHTDPDWEAFKKFKQFQQGGGQAAPNAPVAGSLLKAKCSACHDEFDGVQPITLDTFTRYEQMYMQTHNGLQAAKPVPAKMQAVLGKLSEEDHLNIKAEMLGLLSNDEPAEEAGVLK